MGKREREVIVRRRNYNLFELLPLPGDGSLPTGVASQPNFVNPLPPVGVVVIPRDVFAPLAAVKVLLLLVLAHHARVAP